MPAQTRSIWDIGEHKPGETASTDPGAFEETYKASEAMDFGILAAKGASNLLVDLPVAGDTVIEGLTMIDDLAGDYANSAYLADDAVAIMKRGKAYVKIDSADAPAAGGAVLISTAAGKEGWLVGTPAAGVTLVCAGGIRIKQVLDNVAEIYLDGSPDYTVAVSV